MEALIVAIGMAFAFQLLLWDGARTPSLLHLHGRHLHGRHLHGHHHFPAAAPGADAGPRPTPPRSWTAS